MVSVIKVLDNAFTGQKPLTDTWIAGVDFEANGGWGSIELTNDFGRAMRFESNKTALRFWRTQPRSRPLRPDGKPNRPLTMYTVEITELP
jgi:hypothetical protein